MATAIYGAIEEFDLINGIKINEYIERLEHEWNSKISGHAENRILGSALFEIVIVKSHI